MRSPDTGRVLDLLLATGRTLALAESCTGGGAGAELTSVAGASKVFAGSLVTYSNEAKIRVLDVPAELIDRKGAVSPETAIAMARGARTRFGADVAAAVTGLAGPPASAGSGPDRPPVGTVWFAFVDDSREEALCEFFDGGRDAVRNAATLCLFRYLAIFLDPK